MAMASIQETSFTHTVHPPLDTLARPAGTRRLLEPRQLVVDAVGLRELRVGALERVEALQRAGFVALLRQQPSHLVQRPRLLRVELERARKRPLRHLHAAEAAHRTA